MTVKAKVVSAMSQSTLFQDNTGFQNASESGSYDAAAGNEFNYRPVPMVAPLSLAFGLLSGLGFLGLLCIPIGLVGTFVSLFCILWLRKRGKEYGGMWLGVLGLLLSVTCFTCSAVIWVQGYRTEVPEGFARINFLEDISKKGFVESKTANDFFHPDVKKFDGQKVFLKGYMYPTKQINGLTTFLLVKDMGQCCFGGNPKPCDMVLVNMDQRKAVNYLTGLVSVSGVFHCQPMPFSQANLNPVYTMDATLVENSRTMF
jgi:hypothetical protein